MTTAVKPKSSLAYALLLPALLVMAFCGLVPLGFALFYSVHDTFFGNQFFWVGLHWYAQILSSAEFFSALARSLAFSFLALAIEVPLGIFIALRLPQGGRYTNLYIVLMAIPLLTPWILVGYIWKVLTLPQIGLLSVGAGAIGIDYDINDPLFVWTTIVLMDVWHWTSLVVLLCFAGLRTIPREYYQAALIDGASEWAIFRHIQLPKLSLVLLIAVLLRFMDSFMIYTEAYVIARGGPGVSTTFLSNELVQTATVQFDLGEGGAMSVTYLAIVLCISWVFYALITRTPSNVPRRTGA